MEFFRVHQWENFTVLERPLSDIHANRFEYKLSFKTNYDRLITISSISSAILYYDRFTLYSAITLSSYRHLLRRMTQYLLYICVF